MSSARTIEVLQQVLTKKRLSYAWITAAMLWASWVVSIATGPGLLDRFGRVIGADYLEFYAAGRALSSGDSARLYDVNFMSALEREIIGPSLGRYYGFLTPPFLAWVYEPLSRAPYLWSFALWTACGLALLWLSLHILASTRAPVGILWSLTFLPVFSAVTFGQNSFLSLFILCLAFTLWRRGSLAAAGTVASLLSFKPQLLVGVALLWLVRWRRDWPALIGLAAGGATLAVASLVFLPEASFAYLRFASNVLPGLPHWLEFPLWNLHTARGFWWLLLPQHERLADALWVLTVLGLTAGFVRYAGLFADQPALLFSGAITLTLLATPHALIYDWALLLIPAALLWREVPACRGEWRVLFAIVWVSALVSGPLTLLQQRHLPFSVQISVPMLLGAAWLGWTALRRTTHRLDDRTVLA